MDKAWYQKPAFYVPGIIVLVIAVLMGMFFVPNGQTPARLDHVLGSVEVDAGSGYAPATAGMELEESDRLRTGTDGSVTLILYESVIIRLEENTEILISELSKDHKVVRQESGSMWSKVVKLGGVYDVTTTSTTATVRGTTLRTRTNATNSSKALYELLVAEGIVDAQTGDARYMINGREKLIGIDGRYNKTNLSAEDLAEIREQLEFELGVLREIRLHEVLKNDALMSFARKTYDATDEDVAQFLLDIDEGRVSEQEIKENAPVITEDMERIFIYNAEIRKTLDLIDEYS
jgi:hypothetical protein